MTLYHFPVALSWSGPGSPGVNMWDIRTTGDDPGGTDVDLDAMSAAIEDFYVSLQTAEIFPAGYTASFDGLATTIGPDPVFTASPSWTHTQGSGGGSAPQSAQGIVTIRTSSAGRSGRGRKFIGPVGSNTVAADGTPNTALVTALQNAADALLAESTGSANGAVGVWSEAGQVFRDATALQARNYFAVLRSRRD